MKSTFGTVMAVLLGSASIVSAAEGTEAAGLSWLTIMFLFFGALIIVFQMVPGVTLFVGMIKGLFWGPKDVAVAGTGKKEKP